MGSWREPATWRVYGRWGLVVLLVFAAVTNTAATSGGRYLTPAAVAAVLCGSALLVRRLPWALAPALSVVATALWGWVLLPLLLVALFDLAADRRARIAVGCAVTVLVADVFTAPVVSLWKPQQYGSSLFLLLAVVGGLWMGSRRRLVEALGTQVEHLRVERELREQAARAAERSRIAAEMHDVLAHRLSLLALHTGVLTTKADALPQPVAERLSLLRTASTEALADLRDVLGALRDTGTEAATGPAAPVLREADELVEQARAAGQHIDFHATGLPEQAPVAHRLAVYRIVQEGLTNARKHAQCAPVTIRLCYASPDTTVEISNTAGAPAPGRIDSGFGLVGLRERVAALGGHLHAGPCGAGAWRLAARIPHPPATGQNGSRT
ncbi:sensor histidine kinase [Streptomyces sp. WMMB 322]|uniref:sensor histidine kinase n=1 Tax=Streptomyces sp. WMMB 322 TaxID=1286821 RepID=UPI000823DF56|nr:histidine kinase [Streptomyces sp. WMMB 322]SCK58863.1 Signal transduction histidine kinase [Streptomyces sp. WMMB 322]